MDVCTSLSGWAFRAASMGPLNRSDPPCVWLACGMRGLRLTAVPRFTTSMPYMTRATPEHIGGGFTNLSVSAAGLLSPERLPGLARSGILLAFQIVVSRRDLVSSNRTSDPNCKLNTSVTGRKSIKTTTAQRLPATTAVGIQLVGLLSDDLLERGKAQPRYGHRRRSCNHDQDFGVDRPCASAFI